MKERSHKLRALALSAVVLASCGTTTDDSERSQGPIVNGNLDRGDPAVVYLSLGNSACTGSVIAKRWVMTAKHCVQEITADQAAVYEGANPMGREGRALAETGDIRAIHLYDEGWDIDGVDIALLESSVDLDVQPIPYSRSRNAPAQGAAVEAAGYGQSDDWAGPDGAKRRGSATVQSNDGNEIWTTSVICFGDSGGPLFDDQGTVVGISSRITDSCSVADAIFTNVGYFASWIGQRVPDVVEPEPEPEPDPEPEPNPEPDPEPEPDPRPGDDAEPDTDSDTEQGADAEPEPEQNPEPDPGNGPAPEPPDSDPELGDLGSFGDPCEHGEACASNACVSVAPGEGYCTEACSTNDCPYGFRCTETPQGGFCMLDGPAPEAPTVDSPYGPPRPSGLGTCSAAPRGSAEGRSSILLAGLAALAVRRRRRRRRWMASGRANP